MLLRSFGVIDVKLGGNLLHKVDTKEFKRLALVKSPSARGASHWSWVAA